jgi:hypothetical protein
MLNLVSILVFILLLGGFGSYSLIRPAKVREFGIRGASQGLTGKLKWLVAYMRSDSQLTYIRFVEFALG